MVAQDRVDDHKASAPEAGDELLDRADLGGAAQKAAVNAVEVNVDPGPVIRDALHLLR